MSAGLEIVGLTVAFGGIIAVDDATLAAPMERITGLIGPNGAGKTTTFNACSGLVRPHAGVVALFGHDVTNASPPVRARRGLGRTFQRVEVCHARTVRENILIGCEARAAGRSPFGQLVAPRRQQAAIDTAVDAAMTRCGIADIAHVRVSDLSTGQQRLVELARVLAGGFRFLLLDEPSSGLDESETERFAAVLVAAVHEAGIGVLLVEHDMDLVMGVCSDIYVLDFGRVIFNGAPDQVRNSPLVRAAYLGADEAALSPVPR